MSKSPYNIVIVPDPVLKQVAQPVETITDDVRTQLDRMLETMYEASGIGLAANQVGLLNRVIVMDISGREDGQDRNPFFMINPEIVWTGEEISVMEEGCLSIPGQFAEVRRPASIRVRYIDRDGQTQEYVAEGLASHCVQHEIDHLNGVLFVDYLSSLKRNMILRKVKKLARGQDVL